MIIKKQKSGKNVKYQTKTVVILITFMLPFFAGCRVVRKEISEGTRMEITIVDEQKVPDQMKENIEKMIEKPFQITYLEGEWLYIAQGYGKQETTGYAIRIDNCMEGKEAIWVETTLLGPGSAEIEKDEEGQGNICIREDEFSKYPYVVWKITKSKKPIIFE